MTGEERRFRAAFAAVVARGEKPTPKALNEEQGFDGRRAIPGRLSGLRQRLLTAQGYVFNTTTQRWNK